MSKRSGVSRAYISAIERGKGKRPGADIVRRLEAVLGVTGPETDPAAEAPPGLEEVARELNLDSDEVAFLSGLRIRGQQPRTKERWDFIYKAMLASESLDAPSRYGGGDENPPRRM